ncbi:hypothetical protein BGX23_003093, partial [Mortierella sp. AD031]
APHVRRPDLYPDKTCRVCEREEEDSEHLWICEASRDRQEEILRDAYSRIGKWGQTATKTYNKDRKKKKRNRAGGAEPTAVVWNTPSVWDCSSAVRELVEWPRRMGDRWGSHKERRGR